MEERLSSKTILTIEDATQQSIKKVFQEVFQGEKPPQHTVVQQNATQAMSYLTRVEEYSAATRPDLILLDLNLSEQTSKTLLTEIKANPSLKRIPIVVLAASTEQADVFQCYALQGNCYVVKSEDDEELLAIAKKIRDFWLEIVTLPLE